jgi:hypothetical protein
MRSPVDLRSGNSNGFRLERFHFARLKNHANAALLRAREFDPARTSLYKFRIILKVALGMF